MNNNRGREKSGGSIFSNGKEEGGGGGGGEDGHLNVFCFFWGGESLDQNQKGGKKTGREKNSNP